MYHFSADHPPEPVRLSFRALIPGHVRQYLKDFQLEAIRFMHKFLVKGEFCVYNDESGLGKQASVAVLLDAACSSRKCLIVVQNDDRYVSGWEFHFKVLTNTNISIIKDEKDSTDSPHSIYITKWSTLRTIDDLTKFKFDYIILDNRGQMLNNSFCTSMLLKHYERKINVLISSVDITSDLKLLHNVLRLGGRLDPQYSNFKAFEEKFKLPDAKELAYKRVDLEEYFCKRERLADYCKAFRLRRYCHQYESQLPLVKADRYKINLGLWRDKQNATNSESSSIEYINQRNHQEEQIKDTQELFEEYCRQRRKQHLQFQQEEERRLHQKERDMLKSIEAEEQTIYNVDDEVASITDTPALTTEKPQTSRENSDELVLMSPLLVESESDVDDTPEICNSTNNIEIVDLESDEQGEEEDEQKTEGTKTTSNSKKKTKRKIFRKRSEIDRLEEDIVDTLKIKDTPKRLSRHTKSVGKPESKNKRLKDRLEEKRTKNPCANDKTPTSLKVTANTKIRVKNEYNTPDAKRNSEKPVKEIKKDSSKHAEKTMKENSITPKNKRTELSISKSNLQEKGKNPSSDAANTTPLTTRKTRTVVLDKENTPNTPTADLSDSQRQIKQEVLEETPKAKKIKSKDAPTKVNSEKLRLKREMEIAPAGIHLKQTRSMQRLTRSAGGSSKYLSKNLSLQIDKASKCKKKLNLKEAAKRDIGTNKNKDLKCRKKHTEKNENLTADKYKDLKNVKKKNEKSIEDKSKNTIKSTQSSIISHRSSQDYESLQCAQRLSDAGVFDQGLEKSTEFLVPPTPNAGGRNSLLPSSLTSSTGFLTESGEVIFIPPSNQTMKAVNKKRDQIILLSSSDNENSSQSSSTNMSTTSRRTRALKPKRNQQSKPGETNKVPSFSNLLVEQNIRLSTKSPDLFSNCSDLIPCTQTNNEEPKEPFEGFKIFGSEVKQMQQHYAFSKNFNRKDTGLKKPYRDQRSCLDILEKMFEPSNKKSKSTQLDKASTSNKKTYRSESTTNNLKTNTQILPSHPIEAINEARQHQEKQKRKLSTTASSSGLLQDDDIFEITNNVTFGSVMRLHSNGDISPVQNTQKANSKQHNKITNYLIGNAIQNGSQDEPTPNSGNSAGNFFMEAGTPSKKHQQLSATQNNNVKKSPKSKCNTTQATKLTKWFTKPSDMVSGPVSTAKTKSSKTPTKQVQENKKIDVATKAASTSPSSAGKRILKRRRLDLSFSK